MIVLTTAIAFVVGACAGFILFCLLSVNEDHLEGTVEDRDA